ncbi:YfhO family protein [Salibacter sp.]|uniref:YfhO family protein n=1 Tax=Salibacter sp. TaxID=2010995 RepID=UPI00287035F1|nr:YfhO family protein [Salibacter sp.]MDR9399137.1 YfhO family protein [Salibacter sp.]MDR9488112.1 YfhO family protein [Salibacter sp.]
MQIDKNKALIHGIAIVLFLVISGVFFSPAFQGFVLSQGDIQSWVGMSRAILDYREAYGSEPLWTANMFGGMPAFQISMITDGNLLGYINELRNIYPRPPFYFFVMMSSFYILMLTLKVRPRLAILGALAFAFSSFFMISLEAGHNSKIDAVSYLPAIVAGMILVVRKKYIPGSILTAVALSLQIAANHFQITYYTAITLLVIGIAEMVRALKQQEQKHLLKVIGFLVVAALLAVSSNITRLWTTYTYVESTMRGENELTIEADGAKNLTGQESGLDKDYITNWSLGIGETWSLLFPNAKGGPTGAIGNNEDALEEVSPRARQYVGQMNQYWGNQPFTAGPVYVGAIIVLLFFLGAFTVKHWLKWPLVVLTALSIMLAWGKNFMWFTELFIDYFPMYNKFRSVTMMLMVAEFAMPLLGVLFLKELIEKNNFWKENKKKILTVSGVLAGIMILFMITPSSFFDFYANGELARFEAQKSSNPQAASQIDMMLAELEKARESIFKADLLRSFFLVLLGFIGVFLIGVKKIQPKVIVPILAAVILLDLWFVDRRYIHNDKNGRNYEKWVKKEGQRQPYKAQPYDLQILQSELQNRPKVSQEVEKNMAELQQKEGNLDESDRNKVMFSTLDSMSNYRVLDLVNNTYNSSRSSYFHKTIGGYNAAKLMRYQQLIEFHMSSGGQFNRSVLNMLNTKYIIQKTQNGPSVTQNPEAIGHAWLAKNVNWVPNADEEIKALDNFNPRTDVVIDERFKDEVSQNDYSQEGTVTLEQFKLNDLKYSVDLTEKSFIVFSEIFYQPGWQAYIDGEEVDHIRVNWILRGMEVTAGEHEVVFKFRPASYAIGEKVSFASSLLLVLLAIGVLIKSLRDKNE